MTYVSNIRWSIEMTKKLVEEYGKHECLWNLNIPDYGNRVKRDSSYENLRRTLAIPGLSIKELKWKIKNMRSTYSSELKKMFESQKKNPRDPYIPRVAWFKIVDSYLRQHITQYFSRRTKFTKQEGSPVVPMKRPSSGSANGSDLQVPKVTVKVTRIDSVVPENGESSEEQEKTEAMDMVMAEYEDVVPETKVLVRVSEKWLPSDGSVAAVELADSAPPMREDAASPSDANTPAAIQDCTMTLAYDPCLVGDGSPPATPAPSRRRRSAMSVHRFSHQSAVDHSYTSAKRSMSPAAAQEPPQPLPTPHGPLPVNDDEFSAFANSVAAQLRRMPLRMAVRAELQIQSFLTEARLYACAGYEDFPEES